MYKMIDNEEDGNFEGCGFVSKEFGLIYVDLSDGSVVIRDGQFDRASEVSVDDIPKFILALQGVYDHVKGKK